jgi:hypothetical protein
MKPHLKQILFMFSVLMALSGLLAACTMPDGAVAIGGSENGGDNNPLELQIKERETPMPTVMPELNVARIQIQTQEGKAEFYDSESGEKFIPRGWNYIHFLPTERDSFEDRVMAENHYDPERVREAFRQMNEAGYNTVRIFWDLCSYGRYCLGKENGEGLNPGYLDNMVDLMRIAGQERIYILFTANALPENGGYSRMFDRLLSENPAYGFEDYRNSDWLHISGVEAKKKLWQDLMDGLIERDAPFEVVLGWQLTNEFWLWGQVPPFSLTEGVVTTANGKSYDMANPDQKYLMAAEGTIYFMEQVVPIIKAADPQALTTMGFFAPYFGGQDRYFVTDYLLQVPTPIDFWDFHAYTDSGLELDGQAASFGMQGYEEKPIIMGEFASGHEFVPSAASALTKNIEWIADSCDYGFDGWLYWGYYPWPDEVGGKAWAGLEDDGLLFDNLSPVRNPDPCNPSATLDKYNAAYKQPVRASAYWAAEQNIPENAVDGTQKIWNSGGYPPHWIEINLGEPTTITRVAMNNSQWPPGVTNHQVTVQRSDGSTVILGTLEGFTTVEQLLAIDLPIPLEDVVRVRVNTTESTGWAGWTEIEAIASTADGQACLARAAGVTDVLSDPEEEADRIGSVPAGIWLHVDGFYTDPDGTTWLRNGGDSWARMAGMTLEGDCDQEALAAEPQPRLIPITWRVTVPEGTPGEVFMAGDFPGMGWPFWRSWMIVLTKTGANSHEVTIPLPEGSSIEYLFNRQTWDSVERTASCGNVPNRTLTVSEPAVIEITVEAWRDLQCGGE